MRQNRLLEVEKRQEKLIRDVEEIISSSLFEMKEENEAFIQRVKKISNQATTSANIIEASKTDKAISNGNKEELIGSEWVEKVGNVLKKQAVKAYKNSSLAQEVNGNQMDHAEILSELNYEDEIQKSTDRVELSNEENENPQMSHEEIYRDLFVNQVLILQKDGFSTEEIAKKLGKGHTEIELLLKFSQNK